MDLLLCALKAHISKILYLFDTKVIYVSHFNKEYIFYADQN